MNKWISVIGGDLRIVKLAELYVQENNLVYSYGQEKYFLEKSHKINVCEKLDDCIASSEIIISGMPITKDNKTINCLYSDEVIRLDFLLDKLKNKTFIAGAIPEWFKSQSKDIKIFELLDSEPLNILNAIPTVEGTIKIAIEETDDTIHESNILVLGYGRIGKILCDRFGKLGANIYCAARKEADLAWIREKCYIPVQYNEISDFVEDIDIIINTVPNIVIKNDVLSRIKKECFIIDLASEPGGVDKNVAKMYNIKVITASGIPGKIAPTTAAKYIKNIIEKLI